MKSLLRTKRIFCAISIFFCILARGVIGIEDRSISSNDDNVETTKPLPFVIPSYASGILNPKSTPIASNVSPPSQFLLPPIIVLNTFETTTESFLRRINITTLNSNEPETTTSLLPLTQRFNSPSVTERSNFDGKIDTIQPIPKTFQFNTKSTTPSPSTSKTTTTTKTKTIAASTQNSSLFTTKFGDTFEKSTLSPVFGFRQSRPDDEILDDILGNQKPGYAIRPDGSIDFDALPPETIKHPKHTPHDTLTSSAKFTTTEIPTTTETIPISRTSSPITTKFIATTKVSKNFTHSPWLQQASPPYKQITPFLKQNSKSFIPSTTSNQPTTTDFPLETTTQSFFEGFAPSKIGIINLSNHQNGSVFGSGIRDWSMVAGTTLPALETNIRSQFITSSSPNPFNIIETSTVTRSFNFNTQTPALNGFHNNIEKSFTKSNLLHPIQENIQLPISLHTTSLPHKNFPTIFSSTVPTTITTTVPKNIDHPPAITMPIIDLLPPTTANVKFDTMTNEAKPNDFSPQLDLNPFLAPFLGSVQNSNDAETTKTAPLPRTTIKNSEVLLQDFPFPYKKPAAPFQQPNIKYTGSFGAPPGILTPYDNLN